MNQWKQISEFPYPTEEWDVCGPKYLLYSQKTGIVIGSCYMDCGHERCPQYYMFRYDRDGLVIEPTHWMELPLTPNN